MPDNPTHQAAHPPGPPVPGTDGVRAAWTTITHHLACRRDRIYEEIKAYPPPIPACDQQYNHLLEQRTRIGLELTRLDRAMNESVTDPDPAGCIEQFIRSSSFIDTDTARKIRALLSRVC